RSAEQLGAEPVVDPGRPMPKHPHHDGSLELKIDEGSSSAEKPDSAKKKHKNKEDNLDLNLSGLDEGSKPASGDKHHKGLDEQKDKDPQKASVLDGLDFPKTPKDTTEKVASGQSSKNNDLAAPVGSTDTGAEKTRAVKLPTSLPAAVNPDKPKESL